MSAFIRNIIGAASSSDLDAVAAAVASAREMREAAEAVRALAERTGAETAAAGRAMESEVARLTARLEAMPEMRAQLEQFVQSLGRTMTGAAERLDSVDDRMHHLEQQSRAQSEVLSIARAELDRQGRVLAEMAPEVRALLAATERLAAATERTEALVREVEERKVRAGRTERVALVAASVPRQAQRRDREAWLETHTAPRHRQSCLSTRTTRRDRCHRRVLGSSLRTPSHRTRW